jgi:hypothetical protein
MRLDAPERISIELQGRSVTIMSSNAPRMTFDADGRDREEYGPGGRPITTHADIYGDELTVRSSGNRGTDFTVRFEPVQNGLRVTRQVTSDYNDLSAVESSLYRRTSPDPTWNIYNGGYGQPDRRGGGPGPRGVVLIPDNVQMSARTNRDLVASSSHEGDLFTMTVESGPYRGAVVDGIVIKTYSGGGHASMDFDFDRIRLSDGRSGPFEAEVEYARTPDGREIRANHEGAVRGDPTNADRPRDTAIGATLGAIIGAIAGGGKGAAIGAVVGGAGTFIIQGQNDLRLPAGTVFTFTTVAPRTVAAR